MTYADMTVALLQNKYALADYVISRSLYNQHELPEKTFFLFILTSFNLPFKLSIVRSK